jgi:hypothetical protein
VVSGIHAEDNGKLCLEEVNGIFVSSIWLLEFWLLESSSPYKINGNLHSGK